jgi:hypothetical protein
MNELARWKKGEKVGEKMGQWAGGGMTGERSF